MTARFVFGRGARAFLLVAALAAAGCANDPHPSAPDTPGDPWHPPSNEVPAQYRDGSTEPTPAQAAQPIPAPAPPPTPETHQGS